MGGGGVTDEDLYVFRVFAPCAINFAIAFILLIRSCYRIVISDLDANRYNC